MSQGRTFRIRDVVAYLGVSHKRADPDVPRRQFPKPEQVDAIGPQWKAATIEQEEAAEGRVGTPPVRLGTTTLTLALLRHLR